MADSTGETDSSIVVRNRGQKPEEQTNSTAEQQIQPQQNQNQAAQPQQEAGSPWKGMIVRMVIFYFIINFFRSKGPSTNTNSGSSKVDTGPCMNVFKNGDLMVRYCKKN